MYAEAKELYERAIPVMQKTGNRKGEAINYECLGNLFIDAGEYVNAKECQEKSLAISMEIGDREGEPASYANLGTVFQIGRAHV